MEHKISLHEGSKIITRKGEVSDLVFLSERSHHQRNGSKVRMCRVKCPCGEIFEAALASIRSGKTKTCPTCSRKRVGERNQRNLIGKYFGRLEVLSISGRHENRRLLYTCRCSCGAVITGIHGRSLTRGDTRSCGCLKRDLMAARFGTAWKPGDIVGDIGYQFKILEKVSSKTQKYRFRVENLRTGNICTLKVDTIKRQATALGHLECLLRDRVRKAMKNQNIHKTRGFIQELPWTVHDIFQHVGPCPGRNYHLDHICPCAQAATEQELIQLFSPANLRWLHSTANRQKNAKKTPEGVRLCRELLGRDWIGEDI